jgi:D-sedoheptulose 7-phosphate isomerase
MNTARPDLLSVSSRAVDDYLEDLRGALDRLNVEALGEVLAKLVGALDAGCRVFVAGNGGSATITSHFVADLSAAMALRGSESALVCGLADNVARVTAIANDISYDRSSPTSWPAGRAQGTSCCS